MKADFSYYVLENVQSKDGAGHPQNFYPPHLIGRLCYIGYLQTGERAFINVADESTRTFRAIHTSTVGDYRESDNGSRMEIETMNRIYRLRLATTDEINTTLSALRKKPITTPIRASGFYGS
jgi:hypothetical protein